MNVRNLPLLEDAKFIVIDEGLDAKYGRQLIAGWLYTWNEKNPNQKCELLSFSNPKSWYQNGPDIFKKLNVQDLYTLDTGKQPTDSIQLNCRLHDLNKNSLTIIDSLNSLVLYVGLAKSLHFIEKLRKQVGKLICIYQRDFFDMKIPCIDTLGTTYVQLKYMGIRSNYDINYTAKLVHRKLGGSVIIQSEIVRQNFESYEIKSEKIIEESNAKSTPKESDKIESSFRIEINAHEMEQRQKTPLPYTHVTNIINTSKILYQPDEVDDLDEEDPDDDLCF